MATGGVVGLSSKNRFRSKDVTSNGTNTDVTFEQLGLPPNLVTALYKAGFETPSPIQVQAIPLARFGADLIVQAKAGTGKTCVFAVATLESVDINNKSPQVLILAPTREIAIQIEQVLNSIIAHDDSMSHSVKCRSFIGGLSIKEDINQVKRCQIVVATPGRVKHMIADRKLDLTSLKMLVLDEADKLLDEKFESIVNWICSVLPERKQMLALSATYPERLAKFLSNYMREPLYVRLDADCMALVSVKQVLIDLTLTSNQKESVVAVDKTADFSRENFEKKEKAICALLNTISFNQCLVFCNLHAHADQITQHLKTQGWSVSFIAGSQSQTQRIESMRQMKNYEIRVFVCTDLISRGVDLEHVDLVINLDVPNDWKTYMHRVGRAGRFGNKGAAFTILSNDEDVSKFKHIASRCNLQNVMLVKSTDQLPSNFIAEQHNVDLHHGKLCDELNDLAIASSKDVKTQGEKMATNVSESLITGLVKPRLSASKTIEQELTIPEDVHEEMNDLIRLYNTTFRGSTYKVKLNVEQFTFESFIDHYRHFDQTGEFKPAGDWLKRELVKFEPLGLKNFFKQKEHFEETKESKEVFTQTEYSNSPADVTAEYVKAEVDPNVSCNRTNKSLLDNKNQSSSRNRFECGMSFFSCDETTLSNVANCHYAYLNSVQHTYLSTALSNYFGGTN